MKSARELLYNSVPTGNTIALNPEKWLNGKLCDVVFTTIKRERQRKTEISSAAMRRKDYESIKVKIEKPVRNYCTVWQNHLGRARMLAGMMAVELEKGRQSVSGGQANRTRG